MSSGPQLKSTSPRASARETPIDLPYAGAPGCRGCGKPIPQDAIYCPHCNAESHRGITPRWLDVVLTLVVFGAAAAAFSPALDAQFVNFDDDKNLLDNFDFRGLSATHLTWMFTTHKMGHYQPLSWLTLAVDYSLGGFTGLQYAHGGRFHVTNILLHALGAVAFYFLARRVLVCAFRATTQERFVLAAAPDVAVRPGRIDLAICAAIAALLFAIHPLRCESVAWVTERRDVLSGLFFTLAILAYIRSVPETRERRLRPLWFVMAFIAALITLAMFFVWFDDRKRPAAGSFQFRGMEPYQLVLTAIFFIGMTVATALAMRSRPRSTFFLLAIGGLVISLFSKAWGMVMPAVLIVLDIWPLRRLGASVEAPFAAEPRNQKGAARRRAPAVNRSVSLLDLLLEKVPFVVLSLIFGALAKWSQAAQADTMKSFEQHGIAQRLAQGFYGLMFYVWKTFVPTNLLPIYEIPEPFNVLTPRFVIAAVLVIAATVAMFIYRKRYPALLAAWVCYGIIVSPVLGVLQSGPQLVADRYSYLSCMPFVLLVAGGLLLAVRRSMLWRSPAYSLGFLAAGVLAVLTWRQCGVWENSEAMWTYTHQGDPNSYNACQNLGIIKKEKGLYDEALELYRQGHALHPSPQFLTNIANIYSAKARQTSDPKDRGAHLEEAAEYSRRAIEMAREKRLLQAELFINYGVVLQELERLQEAEQQYRMALRIKEKHPKAHNNLAAVLTKLKRYAEAIEHAKIAVELDPLYVNGWRTLGRAYKGAGQDAEAAEAFKRAANPR